MRLSYIWNSTLKFWFHFNSLLFIIMPFRCSEIHTMASLLLYCSYFQSLCFTFTWQIKDFTPEICLPLYSSCYWKNRWSQHVGFFYFWCKTCSKWQLELLQAWQVSHKGDHCCCQLQWQCFRKKRIALPAKNKWLDHLDILILLS